MIERAGLAGIKASPWLALAAPVHEAHQSQVEQLAVFEQVIVEAMLVPVVVQPLHLTDEYQQERR